MAIPYVENPPWADGSGGGTPINAAKLNNLEQGISDAHLMPAVRVYRTGVLSVSSSTITAVTFDAERFDQASGTASTHHDNATNNSRLTCRYAGIYLITGTVEFASNATGVRQVGIRHQGSTQIANNECLAVSGGPTLLSVTTIFQLAVNEYVEMIVQQTSGGALNIGATGDYGSEFGMVRVA